MESSDFSGQKSSEERQLEMEEQIHTIHGREIKAETAAAASANAAEENPEEPEAEAMSVEKAFEGKRVPPWREQLTFRAMAVSFFLSVMFSVIVLKFNLTTGVVPSLNVAAGLLGFFFVKVWTKTIHGCGLLKRPFTRQENTIIQTCVVAASDISFSGGFGNYLFAMSSRIANQSGNASSENIKDPQLGWMIGFLFLVSFIGLFSLVPLRKIMIIDYKLTYPSGTATAHLINGFHTPHGAKLAEKQVRTLGKFFVASFLWGFFQWFYTGGNDCGFANFPTLGLKAYNNMFYFDFSATYVGTGMICSYLVNASLLLGGILSWGLMWPLIRGKSGSWYSADLPDSDLRGLLGYKVFICIAVILGDGLYNILKVMRMTIPAIVARAQSNGAAARRMVRSDNAHPAAGATTSFDERRRSEVFFKDQIPKKVAFAGYVVIAAISTAAIPHIFPQLRWYHVLIIYIFTPLLAFCNAYGCGLTDWSLAAIYGNLVIFVIGAWVGASHGGLLAGLAACGILMGILTTASDLMQDFKTGYLTLSSPASMFAGQAIGTAVGCVIAPTVFWLFYKAFDDLGEPGSEYPAPFAAVYRNVAILGVDGASSLPKHCLALCYAFFSCSVLVNLFRDTVGRKWAKYTPLPMAMAIPFFIGPYFAIDMCIGSLMLFVWRRVDEAKAGAFGMAVASGLICGDGMWALPQSVLALAQVKAPICMRFLSRRNSDRVDAFLSTLS